MKTTAIFAASLAPFAFDTSKLWEKWKSSPKPLHFGNMNYSYEKKLKLKHFLDMRIQNTEDSTRFEATEQGNVNIILPVLTSSSPFPSLP